MPASDPAQASRTSHPFRRAIVVVETLVGLGGLAGSSQLRMACRAALGLGSSSGVGGERTVITELLFQIAFVGFSVQQLIFGGVAAAMAVIAHSHERRARMPGDDIVPRPQFVITHAITIEAPAAAVWPWLVQMGWHRGGWYTARWVDELLFPANRASADHIVEELQDLQVGDFIPDGSPESECGFTVEQLASPRLLVLHSTSHLPLEWRRSGKASVDWTWVFTWCQPRMTVGRG